MEHRSAESLRGRSLHSVADDMLKTRTYGVGRICIMDGCGTLLSAYNPSSVCALHGGGAWQDDFQPNAHTSSRRDEISRRCTFEPCGREFMTTNPAKKYCGDACRMRAFQARVMAARRMGDMRGARRAS
jgi:hypothetical protein